MSATAVPRKTPARSRTKPVMPLLDEGRLHYPKPLLTASERHFLDLLHEAVPEHYVFPQVCMGAIIEPPGYFHGAQRTQARAPYQSKMVDFVVYDGRANKIVCLVELDDYTHDDQGERDAARDALCAEAGYPTIRVDGRSIPEQQVLRHMVLTGVPLRTPRSRPGSEQPGREPFELPLTLREFVFWTGLVLITVLLLTFAWVVVPSSRQHPSERHELRSSTPSHTRTAAVRGPERRQAPRALR